MRNPLTVYNGDLIAGGEFRLADDVTVHVCGTFAAWQGVDPSEFPESINVAAAGPTQIEDYVSLGYTHIKISRIE